MAMSSSRSVHTFHEAFEVIFSDEKEAQWYQKTIRTIGCAVLYTAIAAMIWFTSTASTCSGSNPK